jgi:hypothetical protein
MNGGGGGVHAFPSIGLVSCDYYKPSKSEALRLWPQSCITRAVLQQFPTSTVNNSKT